ncbi:MAG: BON domain-containing protein [Candidatus Eremiobacteraeota bacterium]|nr:BON domain-containing protein [Candidatus Eremiobacteraeota bacterium]MBC5826526.1 BON domain-containing protein [Candidatus Eremiobacteraeota bacterium]
MAGKCPFAAWGAAAVVLAAAACTPAQQQETKSGADDALLLAQLRAKIAAVDAATISLVHVNVRNGVVTLSGQAPSAAERSAIEGTAKSVPGVRTVIDRLAVNPKAPTSRQLADDFALEAQVKAAIARDAGLNALRVHVSAHAAAVTLEGSVPSAALRTVVFDAAKSVPGAKSVSDRLSIKR